MRKVYKFWKLGPVVVFGDLMRAFFCHDAHDIVSAAGWRKLAEMEVEVEDQVETQKQ